MDKHRQIQCFLFIFVLNQVNGALVVRPHDLNVVVGETVHIACQTDLDSYVRWLHKLTVGEGKERTVYWSSGILTTPYKDRFSVKKVGGSMNLTISDVSYKDSGEFICKDYDGEGESSSMNLTVFDTHLSCSHNINSVGVVPADIECSPGPDIINMTCSIYYTGNMAPVLLWIREGSLDTVNIPTVSSPGATGGSRATSTLLMTANTTMNGYQYTCTISHLLVRSSNVSTPRKHSYTFPSLNVLYLSPKEVDTLSGIHQPCPVFTNMANCSYAWSTSPNHRSNETSNNNKQLCTTECQVREDVICKVSALIIITGGEESNGHWKTTILHVCIIVVLVVIGLLILTLLLQKGKPLICQRIFSKRDQYGPNERGVEQTDEPLMNHAPICQPKSDNSTVSSECIVVTIPLTRIRLDTGNQLEVSGVTRLENILYILCRQSPTIFCYNSDSGFDRSGEIELPNVEDPNDMAACSKNSCLYVICTNGEIYRVQVPANTVVRMDLIIEKPPYTLSVTQDGTLIVPHNRTKPDRHMHVDIVAPDLLMLTINDDMKTFSTRKTSLPGEWKDHLGNPHRVYLHHAMQLESGNFLVSYGVKYKYVCEVSSSGTFIESSNHPEFIGSSGHLITAKRLPNSECFVYLTTNEQIVKLNSKMKLIVNEKEFMDVKLIKKEPTRMCCFDQDIFVIGTKHGGAYILTDSSTVRATPAFTKDTCTDSAIVKLNTGGQAEVTGVAKLEKKLYVLCRKFPKIFGYSVESPHEQLDEIVLPNVNDPNDMAACPKNNCLYVICTNGEIYRVQVLTNTVDRIDLIIEKPPYTLSVNQDGTLIIPHDRVKPERYIQKDVVAPDLLMLTVTEKLALSKRMTSLPGEWKDHLGVPHRVKLHHAVQLESGNFLVSYGESCSYVCEVSTSGTFIERSNQAKFSGSSGHLITVQQLPSNEYFVYLTRNEGVIKLNSKLEEISIEEAFKTFTLRKKKKVPTATLR